MRMSPIPLVTLNNGVAMPQLGFGVFQIGPADTPGCVRAALAEGYRLIDTAASYGNEAGVGEAIAGAGIARGEVFVTTKLRNADHGYDQSLRAFDASRARLGLDFVDLYLIHWPLPMRGTAAQTWRAFERIYASGLARAIGVSNFMPRQLAGLLADATVIPAVNQVELHPGLPQEELRGIHAAHGIVTQAWSPLGQGKGLLDDPGVRQIAAAKGRTPAQVVLRWHIQSGIAAIPKSVVPARMRENLAVFDFSLTGADMAALSSLGSGHDRLGPDPETFDVT
jgi:2,5-diketo-D-gluconate reductase A